MDEESLLNYLLRPMLLTGKSSSSLAYGDPGVDQSPLGDGPEHPYSVTMCVLWSSQGLVPNCLFKDVKAQQSHGHCLSSPGDVKFLPGQTYTSPTLGPGGQGRPGTHNVPEEVGQPVGGGAHTTDKLQVLGFRHPLLDQVKDKAGWNEGHGENHTYGNDSIHGSG